MRDSSSEAAVLRVGSRIESVLEEVVFFKRKGLGYEFDSISEL